MCELLPATWVGDLIDLRSMTYRHRQMLFVRFSNSDHIEFHGAKLQGILSGNGSYFGGYLSGELHTVSFASEWWKISCVLRVMNKGKRMTLDQGMERQII